MLCYCHVLWKRQQKETRKACVYNIKLCNNFTDLPDKHSPRFEKQSASISCSTPNEHINIVGLSSPFVFSIYTSQRLLFLKYSHRSLIEVCSQKTLSSGTVIFLKTITFSFITMSGHQVQCITGMATTGTTVRVQSGRQKLLQLFN